jgi:hypothetical protein
MDLGLGKLEKLTILVYGNPERSGSPSDKFEVMFNPASFSMKYCNVFRKGKVLGGSGGTASFVRGRNENLHLELVFDGSGVTGPTGKGPPPAGEKVPDLVNRFLTSCQAMNGVIHQPNFLTIQWGSGELADFPCRLESAEVTYSSFERSGVALRATIKALFIEDTEQTERAQVKENKSSPDLSHAHRVVAGETLPLLCQRYYGDPNQYLFVATANALDSVRGLTPGMRLLFPPLTTPASGDQEGS